MRKIILILFLFGCCYFIYKYTSNDKLFYLNIGDGLAIGINSNNAVSEGYSGRLKNYLDNKKRLKGYNDSFTNKDYRITDINNAIKFHNKVMVNGDEITIDELLKKADIISLSVGMNELYYKLLLNDNNVYGYVDDMLEDMDDLLNSIYRYNKKKVFVMGYYNITNNNYDIFTYLNYNIKKLVKKYNYIYIDLDKLLNNKEEYFKNNDVMYPNNIGYEKIFQIMVDKI